MMPYRKTLAQLSQGLKNGEFTSVELTQSFLERIKANDESLNCFITLAEKSALAAAKKADEQIAAGTAGPLTGIPYAHKDIFCTKGMRTTCGSKMIADWVAPYDSTVSANLNKAGMVCLGKTNMDEFAMGSSNESSYFGGVSNPWDTSRVPGGSSGGSAAAMAARFAPVTTGTDTGGSIRQPAAFCGVTGLKPTYGRVSRFGMIAFASSLDQAGMFAANAEDCAMMLGAMAGFDEKDSTCIDIDVPDYTKNLNKDIKSLKIGLPKEFFSEGLSDEMNNIIQAAISKLKEAGAEFVDISLPNSSLSVPVYYIVAPAECSSNLSRFDGVRFGHRCENPKNLEDLYKRSRGEGFGEEVKRRIMIGTYALSAGYYDAYYIKAQQCRHLISDDFKKAFEQCDVILGPTTPDVAFKAGEKSGNPVEMYLSDIYTIATNLAGLPGMSIPAGFINNLPAGIQLIGKAFDESTLLNVAHQYQQHTDWHTQMPDAYK